MSADQPLRHLPTGGPTALPHGGLVEWYSVSVIRFADGVTRAYFNHLDLPSRRLVPDSLGEPPAEVHGQPWHVMALHAAVEEVEARATGDWRL